MELKLDLTKEYGIVLEGGGAKGAYQVGAWKALREAGIKIKGIAGTSVGSLNGAMMCMDDLDRAEDIWGNIQYSSVMSVDDQLMKAIKTKNFKALNFPQLLSDSWQIIKDGGFDTSPLKQLISESVDEEKIKNSPRELYVMTYSVTEHRELVVDLRAAPSESIKDMLLASAYFLAFKNEKLGGKRYMDGGGFNNVPLNVLIDKGYRDIIVLRIYGLGFDSEKVTKIPDDVTVHHIAPRQDLGGILEFDKKKCRKNMTLGYYDAKRFLYGLAGKVYYIDAPGTEAYYFDKMMSETELLKRYLEKVLDQEMLEQLACYRTYTEDLFPKLAKHLELKADWDYKDLYLAILEDFGKRFRIKRFQIYKVEELVRKITGKAGSLDSVKPL